MQLREKDSNGSKRLKSKNVSIILWMIDSCYFIKLKMVQIKPIKNQDILSHL
jgi:hypothetical protein